VSQLEISGKDVNEEQFIKRPEIIVTLCVFHFDISGKYFREEHPPKRLDISVTLVVSHFDKSGNGDSKVVQLLNK
jgi:hypothetical protein